MEGGKMKEIKTMIKPKEDINNFIDNIKFMYFQDIFNIGIFNLLMAIINLIILIYIITR